MSLTLSDLQTIQDVLEDMLNESGGDARDEVYKALEHLSDEIALRVKAKRVRK